MYYEIDYNIPVSDEVEKNNIKTKFRITEDPSKDPYGYCFQQQKKKEVVDKETNLITPGINSRDKTQVKLNDQFSPDNYNNMYSNSLYDQEKNIIYYPTRDIGAGRGFGNLDLSNTIRYGDSSREDNKEFKESQESQQFFDFQFQILDKNFQDPNHLVMPIPRGGESTRNQNQLSVNTMRSNTQDYEKRIQTIKFNY